MEVDDTVTVSNLTLRLWILYYVKIRIHMLDFTNLHILNGTHEFPMTNILTCLSTLGAGRVVRIRIRIFYRS